MKNKKNYEVIIYGRGGQGAKTTAEVIVQAAIREGKYVQAFPEFGPERSGAPMRSFVRLANQPIRTHEPIVQPDCVLVLDDSIIDKLEVAKNLSPEDPLIINSKKNKDQLQEIIGQETNVFPIDASGLSLEIIGEIRPNTVILGKFSFVTEMIGIDKIVLAFKDKYYSKLGAELTAKNVEAIKKAYDFN